LVAAFAEAASYAITLWSHSSVATRCSKLGFLLFLHGRRLVYFRYLHYRIVSGHVHADFYDQFTVLHLVFYPFFIFHSQVVRGIAREVSEFAQPGA